MSSSIDRRHDSAVSTLPATRRGDRLMSCLLHLGRQCHPDDSVRLMHHHHRHFTMPKASVQC